MDPTIAIVNHSTHVTDDQVKAVVEAVQIQIDTDFSAIWHLGAKLVFWDKANPIPLGVWQLVVADNSDQAGALGYHDLTSTGYPLGNVFVEDDIRYGTQWSATFSHEILEMLADPWINLSAQAGDTLYGYEVCDACEADIYGYNITTKSGAIVLVSDFVLPSWFQPGANVNSPFDVKGHIMNPLELLQDGYISVYKLGSSGWSQKSGRFSSRDVEARSIPTKGHRRFRRGINHDYWKRSTK